MYLVYDFMFEFDVYICWSVVVSSYLICGDWMMVYIEFLLVWVVFSIIVKFVFVMMFLIIVWENLVVDVVVLVL